jgi:hypothetical protein
MKKDKRENREQENGKQKVYKKAGQMEVINLVLKKRNSQGSAQMYSGPKFGNDGTKLEQCFWASSNISPPVFHAARH